MPYIGRAPTSTATKIEDADQDTKIQVEESSDEDIIRFDTGGTERMTVASGGTVDVVGDLTVGTVTADGDTSAGDNATIGYTAAEGLILTGQGSTNDITIKRDDDTAVLEVATGQSDIEVTGGNIFFGTGSKGVYLGVTSATAANLLDDYEEGTFTAAYTFGGSTTGISYNANGNLGRYTKIGRIVICDIYIGLSSKGSESGNVVITGLPFTSVAHGLNTQSVANIGSYTSSWNLSADTHFTGDVGQNSVLISLREGTYESDANAAAVTASMAANDSQLYMSVTYEAT